MTIKKRLLYSNILMILIPSAITVLIAILCLCFIWYAPIHGLGIGLNDYEDFKFTCEAISNEMEQNIIGNREFSFIEEYLDAYDISARITLNSKTIYSYGTKKTNNSLYQTALSLDEDITLIQDDNGLYVRNLAVDSKEYKIYLFGDYQNFRSYTNLQIAFFISGILIVITIVLSIYFTNRFLTKFVLKYIEESLTILVNGVHELRDGNLQYRIAYEAKDEFAAVCDDFNEMARQLENSLITIKKQNYSRKILIAGISHDIRSPLTSVQAYVEGLIDGVAKTSEKQSLYLQMIKKKAEDLAHIVLQLFMFSKMQFDEFPEHKCYVALDELLRKTVAGLKEEYEKKGMIMKTDLSSVTIYADPTQLQRIAVNILSNSLKYANKMPSTATVCLMPIDNGCRMIFQDDGPGVSEEQLPHLFEAFYRTDPARQYPNKGSGLGLAIVDSAVKRMRGTITACNRENGGLMIIIDLPIGENHEKNIDY